MTPTLDLKALRELALKAKADWPAVKRQLDGMAVMAHIHGAGYTGPSINIEALIDSNLALLDELVALRADLARLTTALIALDDFYLEHQSDLESDLEESGGIPNDDVLRGWSRDWALKKVFDIFGRALPALTPPSDRSEP